MRPMNKESRSNSLKIHLVKLASLQPWTGPILTAQAELEIQGAACSCPPPPNRLCGDDDSGNSARAEPATTEGDAIERVNTGSVF
jgi:hypothetical protein